MIHEFIPGDPRVTIDEIDTFIEEMDVERFFESRKKWREGFVHHFRKILAARQYIVFRRHGKMTGFCSWIITDKKNEPKIVKTRWLLPDTITEGDIFYIDICLLKRKASIFKIKDYLVEQYKSRVSEVFWYDMPHRKVFRLAFKGGTLCPTKTAVC